MDLDQLGDFEETRNALAKKVIRPKSDYTGDSIDQGLAKSLSSFLFDRTSDWRIERRILTDRQAERYVLR